MYVLKSNWQYYIFHHVESATAFSAVYASKKKKISLAGCKVGYSALMHEHPIDQSTPGTEQIVQALFSFFPRHPVPILQDAFSL